MPVLVAMATARNLAPCSWNLHAPLPVPVPAWLVQPKIRLAVAGHGVAAGCGRDKVALHYPLKAFKAQLDPALVDEKQLVEEVKERLAKEQSLLRVGKNGRDDEDLLLWFLRDRKYDVDATVAKLTRALVWRRDFGVDVITEEEISEMASTGKAYLHSMPDIEGRPVVVVRAGKHYPGPRTLVPSEKLCVHLIEQALARLPPGGDKILGIFDLRGFKSENGDLEFVRFLVNVFFEYYPKRLGQVLFVDAPFIFQPGWNLVKPWLKSYATLVRFCSAAQVKQDYFTPQTVPPDFSDS